tara:strand:- start:179 stop:877 length:699 start_codon:yes stop_codon:yes gene_type:complete
MAGFWESGTEPKRNFRYKVSIEAFKEVAKDPNTASKNLWFAKKVTKPSFTVGEVKANFVDKTFYYPGRVEWNTCEFTLYDPADPNVVNRMAQMFANSGYFIPGAGPNGEEAVSIDANYGSTAKVNAANNSKSLGDVKIITINEEGHRLEEWWLKNSFIKSMKFGDLSYDSDDMLEVTLEIRYDWAELWSYEIKTDVDGNKVEGTTIFKAFAKSKGKFLNADGSVRDTKIKYK